MLSEDTLKSVSSVFCGDTEGFYVYKSGPKLVSFFNDFLRKKDVYQSGFPSRWMYVYNNLIDAINTNQINKFFSRILSKEYIMQDLKCDEVEAIQRANEVYKHFNKLLRPDTYSLSKRGNEYFLVKDNDDLVLIGSGGFANVYKQKSSGKILKKLKEDYVTDTGVKSRFKREYNLTKSLGDVLGIIRVYDYFDDTCSYTMEEAETTLEKFISSNDLSEDYKIKCIRQLLFVLSEVHKRDIIHRDISPNNIFVLNGMLKVADFGLGKDLHMFTSHQTVHTNAFGQFDYCAPEQFMLLKDGDKRSDIYSLGKLINFIMTGKALNSHHFLRTVTEKATSVNIAFRYADASELLVHIEKSIKFHQQKGAYDTCLGKIKNDEFDDDVESYIFEQSSEKICKDIINNDSKLTAAYIKFMSIDETHSGFVISAIEDSFRDECKGWNAYDPIATFAHKVLLGKFSFVIKEIAARILRYTAYDANRFYAQGLVADAIEKGIEPLIEDIFQN